MRDETKVHVKCPPQFKQTLKDITMTEGQTNIELVVTCDGYPR